ncbi:MAG: BolA family protein [Parvibaculales bacterium]
MIGEIIKEKLNRQLSPQNLQITDESHLHAGHVGARPGGETHFRVKITAAAFAGLSRVERQRLVLDCLAEELAGPVHALAMRCLSPDEAE